MRSQNSVRVHHARRGSAADCGMASCKLHVLYVASPRPGVRPRPHHAQQAHVVLDGGNARGCAQFRISVCTDSMSRSRSGLWASMMAGCFSRSMWLEVRNGGAMQSTEIRSAQVRRRFSSSTVAYRSAAGDLRIAADVAYAVARQVAK